MPFRRLHWICCLYGPCEINAFFKMQYVCMCVRIRTCARGQPQVSLSGTPSTSLRQGLSNRSARSSSTRLLLYRLPSEVKELSISRVWHPAQNFQMGPGESNVSLQAWETFSLLTELYAQPQATLSMTSKYRMPLSL